MINNLNLSNLQKEFKESPFQEFAIKIYNPIDISTWKKGVDHSNLSRSRGFISTSASNFYDFDHHLQPVFEGNKARIYYKPSKQSLGFLKNLK